MPTNRTPISRRGRGLSHAQWLALWLGEGHRGPAFASEDEHRAAWLRHRDRFMTAWGKHGRRPAGWWRFEAPIPEPDHEREQSTLYEAGLLSDYEKAELTKWWREEFSRAQRPDFFFCEGPGRFLRGPDARRAHYAWADIPRALVKRWQVGKKALAESEPRGKENTSGL